MTSITPVNFTGNPNKSFEVFSQQVLKGAKKGQKTNLKDFTHNLTSFTDSFEANKDVMNKKSKKFAEALVGLNKDNMASIVYSFLIKLNRGNLKMVEEFATNALKIAKRLKDPVHIMARANDLREVYKITPPKDDRFMTVLFEEKRALKDIVKNYDSLQAKNKNLKPKDNYRTLLADVQYDIGIRHKDKNVSNQELTEARAMYKELGLTEKAELIKV